MSEKVRMTKKAKRFISEHIRREVKRGKAFKQAVAIAHKKARDKGFKIPPR